jgi:hypothetical protein
MLGWDAVFFQDETAESWLARRGAAGLATRLVRLDFPTPGPTTARCIPSRTCRVDHGRSADGLMVTGDQPRCQHQQDEYGQVRTYGREPEPVGPSIAATTAESAEFDIPGPGRPEAPAAAPHSLLHDQEGSLTRLNCKLS